MVVKLVRTNVTSKNIVRRSRADLKPATTVDWSEFDALTDEDIAVAIRDIPDATPIDDEAWFEKARLVPPPNKAAVSLRLDQEVLDFFKSGGPGYQTRMNAVLRAFMEHEQKKRA